MNKNDIIKVDIQLNQIKVKNIPNWVYFFACPFLDVLTKPSIEYQCLNYRILAIFPSSFVFGKLTFFYTSIILSMQNKH